MQDDANSNQNQEDANNITETVNQNTENNN